MNKIVATIILLLSPMAMVSAQTTVAIDGNNSYITSKKMDGVKLTKKGIEEWISSNTIVTTYVKLYSVGELGVSVRIKNDGKVSNLRATVNGKSFYVNYKSAEYTTIPLGVVQIRDTGYVAISLQGLSRKSLTFGEVTSYELIGSATDKSE